MKRTVDERLEITLREINNVNEKKANLFAIKITKEFSYICTDIKKENLKIPENLKLVGKKIETENVTYEIIFL